MTSFLVIDRKLRRSTKGGGDANKLSTAARLAQGSILAKNNCNSES